MANDPFPDRTPGGRASERPSPSDDEDTLAAKLPPQVKQQPDPMLQMSVGRSGKGGIALVVVAAAVILGFVLYGLNSPGTSEQKATDSGTSAPSAGTAPGTPAAGGNSGAATPGPQRPNGPGNG